MFSKIRKKGWEIEDKDNALLIAGSYFKKEFKELDDALSKFTIPVTDFIRSGGNQAEPTKRLKKIVDSFDWGKNNVESETKVVFSDKSLEPITTKAVSHEIDHLGTDSRKERKFSLEIEWNNKDEFFDRDFAAVKGLYEMGVIEFGIIILKGDTFNEKATKVIEKYFRKRIKSQKDFNKVKKHIESLGGSFTFPTNSQIKDIKKKNKRLKDYPLAVKEIFCSSKYGATTTTWRQIMKRVDRGAVGRLPLIFLGIPDKAIK